MRVGAAAAMEPREELRESARHQRARLARLGQRVVLEAALLVCARAERRALGEVGAAVGGRR